MHFLIAIQNKESAFRGETFLSDENPASNLRQKNDKIVYDQDSFVANNIELCDQSQSSDSSQKIKQLNSAAIVEGPTDSSSSGMDGNKEDESEALSPEMEEVRISKENFIK